MARKSPPQPCRPRSRRPAARASKRRSASSSACWRPPLRPSRRRGSRTCTWPGGGPSPALDPEDISAAARTAPRPPVPGRPAALRAGARRGRARRTYVASCWSTWPAPTRAITPADRRRLGVLLDDLRIASREQPAPPRRPSPAGRALCAALERHRAGTALFAVRDAPAGRGRGAGRTRLAPAGAPVACQADRGHRVARAAPGVQALPLCARSGGGRRAEAATAAAAAPARAPGSPRRASRHRAGRRTGCSRTSAALGRPLAMRLVAHLDRRETQAAPPVRRPGGPGARRLAAVARRHAPAQEGSEPRSRVMCTWPPEFGSVRTSKPKRRAQSWMRWFSPRLSPTSVRMPFARAACGQAAHQFGADPAALPGVGDDDGAFRLVGALDAGVATDADEGLVRRRCRTAPRRPCGPGSRGRAGGSGPAAHRARGVLHAVGTGSARTGPSMKRDARGRGRPGAAGGAARRCRRRPATCVQGRPDNPVAGIAGVAEERSFTRGHDTRRRRRRSPRLRRRPSRPRRLPRPSPRRRLPRPRPPRPRRPSPRAPRQVLEVELVPGVEVEVLVLAVEPLDADQHLVRVDG